MERTITIIKPYVRGMPVIIAAMLIAFFIAKKYLDYATPLYESTSKLKLADINEGTSSGNLFKNLDVFATSNKIATEIEVLKSGELLNQTLDELDFDIKIFRKGKIKTIEIYKQSPVKIKYSDIHKDAFDKLFDFEILNKKEYVLTEPLNNKTYQGILGEALRLPYVKLTLTLSDSLLEKKPNFHLLDTYQFQIQSRQKLINEVRENLDVTSVDKDVPVIRISFKSPNAEKASILADKLAHTYISSYIQDKYNAANITINFLHNRIDEMFKKLSASEQNIQRFRDLKKITNIRQETETDLRQLAQLQLQRAQLKMKLEAIQNLDTYIKNGKDNFLELAPNFEAFTDLLSTEMIKKMKTLQAEKKDLLITYTPEHENVKVIDEKINDITSYFIESIGNTRKFIETEYNDLNNEIYETQKVLIGIPEKEKMLNTLNREFELYQQSYIYLNEKKIEAEIAQAAKIAFHKVITRAQISQDPISPKRKIIKIVAVLLGMFIAIILIFFLQLSHAKVNDKHTVESNSLIPVAMLTPQLNNTREKAHHFLQQAVQLEIKGLIKDIICFSAFHKNSGASFNSFHLAKAMAHQNRKVLFIDAENTLKLAKTKELSPSKVEDNIDVIPLIDVAFMGYTKAMFRAFIKTFKEKYDIIVILNEKITTQKSMPLMSIATTNLVVLDTRATPAKKITEMNLLKEEYKLPAVYFVINRFDDNPNVIKEGLNRTKGFIQKIRNIFHR